MHFRVVVLSCVAWSWGCRSVAPTFTCQSARDCHTASAEGACEPLGYCSFPAADCDSGRRFDSSAAMELADQCVVESTGDAGTMRPVAFVQATSCFESTKGCSVTFPMPNETGNAIVALAFGDASTLLAVSDSQGNVFDSSPLVANPSGTTVRFWYAQNVAAGSNTISVVGSQGSVTGVLVAEYAGLARSGALLDGYAAQSAPTSSAIASTPLLANTANGRILFAGFADNRGVRSGPGAIAAGPGFTTRALQPGGSAMIEDRVLMGSGSNSASATLPQADMSWVAVVAALRAAP